MANPNTKFLAADDFSATRRSVRNLLTAPGLINVYAVKIFLTMQN